MFESENMDCLLAVAGFLRFTSTRKSSSESTEWFKMILASLKVLWSNGISDSLDAEWFLACLALSLLSSSKSIDWEIFSKLYDLLLAFLDFTKSPSSFKIFRSWPIWLSITAEGKGSFALDSIDIEWLLICGDTNSLECPFSFLLDLSLLLLFLSLLACVL